MKNNIFLLFQTVKLFLMKKEAIFLAQERQQRLIHISLRFLKIQIVKKIKAAIGFFCAQ